MTKSKKALFGMLSMLLVAAVAVAGVVMWLTDTTETVENTFTVGNIEIALDEAVVDEYGQETEGRTTEGNNYKLIPGHEYTKDPVVYVQPGSEESYVFVEVVNGISSIEAAGDTTISAQMEDNGWVALDGVENVYYYKGKVSTLGSEEACELTVFDGFVIADEAVVADCEGAVITVKAYAVQVDGSDDAAEAWAKVNA